MYKIIYVPTGNCFELPDETAADLKKKFPEDYKIIEKNGKKFKERLIKKKQSTENEGSIYSKVVVQ